MRRTLITVAAIGIACGAALPAQARSTAQPGQTVGLAYGAPIDPGFYFTNTGSWGERADIGTQSWIDIPDLLWSTPWEIVGGRLQIHIAPNFGYNSSLEDRWGLTNFWGAAQLAWDLGDHWSISYLAGAYTDRSSDVGVASASFNERLGISWTGDNWNLSATILHGIQLDDDDEPGVNDYINLDLTAMKTFRNWQVGFVAFGSTDLSGLNQQSQFAVGGLIGYDFKWLLVQGFITQDITENNYGGEETRFWTRFRIPCKDEMGDLPLK